MSDGIKIAADKFFARVERLLGHLAEHKGSVWGGSDAVSIPLGSSDQENMYSKGAAMHLYLFGYEFPDSVILLTKGNFYFMATKKKCDILQKELSSHQSASSIKLTFLEKTKDEGQNRENFHELLNAARKGNAKKIGCLMKDKANGEFVKKWLEMIDQSQIDKVELNTAVGLFLAVKDENEVEMCKRAAILTNKVMKHSFINEMEEVLDKGSKVSHEKLADAIDKTILDAPNKLQLKIAAEAIDSCFTPIVQSGGKYDIKVSAVSSDGHLSGDVILCSLGARYKGYCASMSRTFMVDVPSKVEKTYGILLSMFNACLEKMVVGNDLKDVYIHAKSFLTSKGHQALVPLMSKSMGFACGLEFRDGTLVLNDKCDAKFTDGMVLVLSVGLHDVPLTAEDKKDAVGNSKNLDKFSLLLADTVRVQKEGVPEVLTKLSKEYSDVSYNIAGDKDGDDDDDDDDGADGGASDGEEGNGERRSKRGADLKKAAAEGAAARQIKQSELMRKKVEAAIRKIEAGEVKEDVEEAELKVNDLAIFNTTEAYPRDTPPNQLRVDLEKECLFVPLNGTPVPFHISTIKAVNMPEPDRATYLRINFYIPGSALGKDVNKNMAGLVGKYGFDKTFIKELTFRSVGGKNLTTVYQQLSELRKRVRQREQRAEQEKDLVVQQKLIRIKDQRIPRLQDLTMRPSLSGRKCVGTIEAHQNGIRFTSTKYEVLDVLYSNIKHAIYQPCDPTTSMVIVHFHLKDFISEF